MTEREQLEQQFNTIETALNLEIEQSIAEDVYMKLTEIQAVMGNSANALQLAMKIRMYKEREEYMKLDRTEPISKLNKELSLRCIDELTLEKRADRLNAALVHSADILRSQLSYLKQEMFQSRMGGGN